MKPPAAAITDFSFGWVDFAILVLLGRYIGYTLDLAGIAASTRPLSAWVDSLPRYSIVKDKITCRREQVDAACAALKQHYGDAQAQEGDGLRLDWPDRWVQVRASNTEPIARVIAEAPDVTQARRLCSEAIVIVKGALGSQ
jgi:phosphomannomutase